MNRRARCAVSIVGWGGPAGCARRRARAAGSARAGDVHPKVDNNAAAPLSKCAFAPRGKNPCGGRGAAGSDARPCTSLARNAVAHGGASVVVLKIGQGSCAGPSSALFIQLDAVLRGGEPSAEKRPSRFPGPCLDAAYADSPKFAPADLLALDFVRRYLAGADVSEIRASGAAPETHFRPHLQGACVEPARGGGCRRRAGWRPTCADASDGSITITNNVQKLIRCMTEPRLRISGERTSGRHRSSCALGEGTGRPESPSEAPRCSVALRTRLSRQLAAGRGGWPIARELFRIAPSSCDVNAWTDHPSGAASRAARAACVETRTATKTDGPLAAWGGRLATRVANTAGRASARLAPDTRALRALRGATHWIKTIIYTTKTKVIR